MSKTTDLIDEWVHQIDEVLAEQSPDLSTLLAERYDQVHKAYPALTEESP